MSFEPQSQQQIQNTVVTYLRRTVAALPPGTLIDAGRFLSAGHNSPCDDPESGPAELMRFHTIGELKTLDDAEVTIAAAGEAWRDWGFDVVEREEFDRPNRFGYSPQGFRLQIVTATAGLAPTIQASSPCFPRLLALDDVPFPTVITAD